MNEILNNFFKVSFGNNEEDISKVDVNSEKGRRNLELIVNNLISDNVTKVSRVEENVKTNNLLLKIRSEILFEFLSWYEK